MTAQINLSNVEADRLAPAPKKVSRMGFRDFLYIAHLWLGVATSIYFCAMSITGISLVFRDELQQLLTHEPKISSSGSLAPLSAVVRNVQERYTGQQVSGLIYPLEADRPLLVYVVDKNENYSPVSVNQYDATVIGPAPENAVLNWLKEAHHNLLFGTTGRKVNAVGGAIFFLIALSGIGLFFRGLKYCLHTLKMRWKGSPNVIAWTMHQQVGFFLLPMLMIWGISGFSFGFRQEFEKALNLVLPVAALSREGKHEGKHKESKQRKETTTPANTTTAEVVSLPNESAPPDVSSSLDLLIPLSMSVCPGQEVARIATAIDKHDIAKVWLTDSHSLNKSDNTEVDISSSKGTIISITRPEERKSGDFVLMWLPKLHFGNFGGVPIKLIWLMLGLSPLILSVTGLMMWWRRGRRLR